MSKDKLYLDKLDDHTRKLVYAQMAAEDDARPKPPKIRKPKREVNPAHWQGKEKDFQRQVEAWLALIGFMKRTKKNIEATQGRGGKHGWILHVVMSMLNPYTLDVILLRNDGRWLEFELKTAKGEPSPTQELLLTSHPERLCRSLEEVWALVMKWMED